MRLALALILSLTFAAFAGAEERESGQADLASSLPPEWVHGKGFNDDSKSKAAKWLQETMGDESSRRPAADSDSNSNSSTLSTPVK